MTLRLQLLMTDDLDEHEKQKYDTPAAETVVISLDGVIRELHLTAEHDAELRQLMGRYLDAGHEPGAQPELVPSSPEPLGPRPGQGRRREIPGTREFYQKVRSYAAAAGAEVPTAGREKKTYIYPDALREAFMAHLQARAQKGDTEAVILLAMARRVAFAPGTARPEPGTTLPVPGVTVLWSTISGKFPPTTERHHVSHDSGEAGPCRSGPGAGRDQAPRVGHRHRSRQADLVAREPRLVPAAPVPRDRQAAAG